MTTLRPACNQLYNIFYASHPSAMRIEPLLHQSFKHINPVKIPRYQKYPYGDSAPIYASMLVLNVDCLTFTYALHWVCI